MSLVFVLTLQDYDGYEVVGVCSTLARAQRMAAEHPSGVGEEWESLDDTGTIWCARTSVAHGGMCDAWEIAVLDLTVDRHDRMA